MQRTRAFRASLVAVVAAVLAVLAWMTWPAADPGAYRPARATVVVPTNCGSSAPGELVRIGPKRPDARRALLNSCGHRAGEVLDVQVRAGQGPAGLDVRLAGTGVTSSAVTQGQVAAILLVVAAAGGAGLAWRLYSGRRPAPRVPRRVGGRHRAAA